MAFLNQIQITDLYLLLGFSLSIIAGAFTVWVVMKFRMKVALETDRTECDSRVAVLEEKLKGKEAVYSELKSKFDRNETFLSQQQYILTDLSAANAVLEEKILQIPVLEKSLADLKIEMKSLENSFSNQKSRITELETLNDQETKRAEEKITLLLKAREQLTNEFKSLANDIFEEKGQKFTAQNNENINRLLNPLRDQIGGFKKRVEDVYDKESRDRISLLEEIKHLKDLNWKISKDAVNLAAALKGNSKVQGNWGEVILERVLEASGLQKGREYDIQTSLMDKSGKRFQPDVIVRLPDKKDVVVDAKVSLKAYENYFSAETEDEKETFLKSHIDSIQAHIKSLSQKQYETLDGLRTLDFVLMFIPIESAFLIAIEKDQDLFSRAFKKNIVMVCPSTLLVTLRAIQNIWQYEYQNQNAQEIAEKAGDLYDKFVGFTESLEDIGKQLDKAKMSYEVAHKRLISGNGNLAGRTEALKKLGVSAKKKLPERLLEEAKTDAA